jgi:hypothetical protein
VKDKTFINVTYALLGTLAVAFWLTLAQQVIPAAVAFGAAGFTYMLLAGVSVWRGIKRIFRKKEK